MAHYLYQLRLTRPALLLEGPTPREGAALKEHGDYLERLTREGVVLLAGRTLPDESTFGIVVFQADSEAAAREIMAQDPAVRENVMRAELHPFRIAFAASGIAPLPAA